MRLVLAVYPQSRTIEAHQPGLPPASPAHDDTLDGGDVIPGFTCLLKDIFDL